MWRMMRREGGRRFGRAWTGGSSISVGPSVGLGSGLVVLDSVSFLGGVLGFGLSIHGFSFGFSGVVYCERAAIESSHRFGVQTPKSTRQAATKRFALGVCPGQYIVKALFFIPYRS
jgi:hypothetical protein